MTERTTEKDKLVKTLAVTRNDLISSLDVPLQRSCKPIVPTVAAPNSNGSLPTGNTDRMGCRNKRVAVRNSYTADGKTLSGDLQITWCPQSDSESTQSTTPTRDSDDVTVVTSNTSSSWESEPCATVTSIDAATRLGSHISSFQAKKRTIPLDSNYYYALEFDEKENFVLQGCLRRRLAQNRVAERWRQ